MKKSLSAIALAAVAAVSLTACGSAPAPQGGSSASAGSAGDKGGSFKACMVSDSGGFDDKSFNQSGKKGLDDAVSELKATAKTAESKNESDFIPNIEGMVQEGCNIIIGVGFLMSNAMGDAAKKNENIKFALVDNPFTENNKTVERANGKPLSFDTAQASFLAGYLAAGMTKTGKVGTYVGMNIPTTAIFADGFADGVAAYNKAKGKNVELLGWNKNDQKGNEVGNFEDVSKGKQLTASLIEQGADIIMPVAGPVGTGTLQAAKDAKAAGKEVSVVWVDSDGYLTNPDYKDLILTSVMKGIDVAVADTIKETQAGKFTNHPFVGTLANNGVGIAPFHDFDSKVPEELKKEIEALKADVASGKVKVESKNSPK